MTFQPSDIEKLAHLARLGVSGDETEVFSQDLNRIIDWVSILQAAPTQGLEPLTHPHEGATPLRLDSVTERPGSQELFKNAAKHEDGFFLVPQVL